MNVFAKRITLGFIFALLIAVFIGYGGTKKKALPLYAEEVDKQSICTVFIQDLKAFSGDIPPTTISDDYYSCINSPLPIASSTTDYRLF